MKIKISLFFIFIIFSFNVNAQEMMNLVKSKISEHLYSTLNKSGGNRFSGGIEVIDAKNQDGYTYVKGTFKYRMVFLIGDDKIVIKKFRAKLKMVLDDISVICFSYVSTNENSCYFDIIDKETGKRITRSVTETTNGECYIQQGSLMDPCGSW